MPNAITIEPNDIIFQAETISKQLTDTVNTLNNVAKDKYNKKNDIVESASDLSTSEKLEAIDRNFAQYTREEYSNLMIFTFLSISILGITAVSPSIIKSFKKAVA